MSGVQDKVSVPDSVFSALPPSVPARMNHIWEMIHPPISLCIFLVFEKLHVILELLNIMNINQRPGSVFVVSFDPRVDSLSQRQFPGLLDVFGDEFSSVVDVVQKQVFGDSVLVEPKSGDIPVSLSSDHFGFGFDEPREFLSVLCLYLKLGEMMSMM